MKVGDKVVRTGEGFMKVKQGEIYIITAVDLEDWGLKLTDLEGNIVDGCYDGNFFELIQKEKFVKVPNYEAAFNMWMDDYMNDPQAYEDSHDSAVRHLKEKLNGEDPSYGAVCAEVLVNYLNKLESK